ncbi:MAG: nucleotide sugar dehydrogenase [Rhizobiales bacterium]|nr:nucleotide sugar dehydrogenase [Hyphomicrobiales bacterium]
MRVAMIGTGYVGLVSGACFADFGHDVTCVDKDKEKIAALERGVIPIYEPGLDDLVKHNSREGRLSFSVDLTEAVGSAAAVFIAVGTPSRRGDGHADLSYIYRAAREIAEKLRDFTVIVTKSTVPVGTGDEVERIIREARPDADFAVVSNPEFLREGAAIRDFKHPDRIVVGFEDERAREVMAELYRPLYLNAAPILYTGRRTAELTKYAANAFLATKITFINEIADLCEKIGADVQEVARGIGLDNRIGTKFLHAGPGFGGSCFPKDTQALIKTAQDYAAPQRIVEAVLAVNDVRKRAMARKVAIALGGSLRNKTIALLGLTFKPNTDDMREAPAISVVTALQDMGATVHAYDPAGMDQAKKVLPDVTYCDTPYSCAEGADALVIVTEWEQFRALDFARLKKSMKSAHLIDLRNVYRAEEVARQGFSYDGIGRPNSHVLNDEPRVVTWLSAAGPSSHAESARELEAFLAHADERGVGA